jgi:hypothetical protein
VDASWEALAGGYTGVPRSEVRRLAFDWPNS